MNYLSHFCIAERECRDDAVAMGSLLPDFLDGAGAVRSTHRVPQRDCASPLWPAIKAGMAHHLEVDRQFHGGDWFEARMREAGEWLKDAQSPLREHWSLSLLRHIAIELVIDGELIRADHELPARLYAAVTRLSTDSSAMSALQDEFCRPDALPRYVERFLALRWLHLYAQTDGVVEVLQGIFSRLVTRRPRLKILNPDGIGFSDVEMAALPAFVEAVRRLVQQAGLPVIRTSMRADRHDNSAVVATALADAGADADAHADAGKAGSTCEDVRA